MATLVVPADDGIIWPTLGPQVCDFLEDRAVHGPGDLRGKPYRLDDEKRALIYRFYEVYPKGHPMAGRRRFKQCDISVRKGTAKTELAAAVSFAEFHPEGPVRCDGFDRYSRPVGRPVADPYVAMVAYTEEQTEELAYAALYVMVTEGTDADLFDAGLDRIVRLDERGRADGRAVPLATSPDARDGARTTFQHFDETHRLVLPRQIETHETMLQNIPKRMEADGWSLGTTTTYTPGEGSVAQTVHEQAEAIAAGKISDPTIFFFHREAGPEHDISNDAGLRAAIRDASGPSVASWNHFAAQVDSIASLYHQAARRGNAAYFERVWLNRRVQGSRRAFDPVAWADLPEDARPSGRRTVTAGFDGSRWRDATGLVLTDCHTMAQWTFAVWTVDPNHPEIDPVLVDAAVDDLFERHNVLRLYGDPAQGWDKRMRRWAERHSSKKIVEFFTDSRGARKTAWACQKYSQAIKGGELRRVIGDDELTEHIGNACRQTLRLLDQDGSPLWTIEKERPDSVKLIDLAMCGVLSWQAALDAIAAGEVVDEAESLVWMA